MNGLIEDGFGLMVLGMGFVFLFLVVLIYATKFMSRLLNNWFPEQTVVAPNSAPKVLTPSGVDAQLTAVITAAVHQHQKSKKS
ncbi:oxaloacetate decarboxylase gamma subunit [Marinomonas alcarazii]|uniref:Probable oxaloacetate decarboxylase gamma chain n=1 Tax=Marinomonas alcarazii TaxID=491949 RepID=A0A318US18_9GAMM|nr:OadG family transporter subunit [Marinomonas alcarazii]PYF79306.1 oxaloacetate decarboxylase gamma subunit [Marinomonas alcarazii]